MAFLNELKGKLSQGSHDVVQKTKDNADVKKLNKTISDAEKTIEKLYSQLGKSYFELHPDDPEDALSQLVEEIQLAQLTILNCQKEIQHLKGICICTNCGATLEKEALFCSRCGTKVEHPVETPVANESSVYHCKKCGIPVPEEYDFCINCGTKAEREPVVTDVIEPNTEKDE